MKFQIKYYLSSKYDLSFWDQKYLTSFLKGTQHSPRDVEQYFCMFVSKPGITHRPSLEGSIFTPRNWACLLFRVLDYLFKISTKISSQRYQSVRSRINFLCPSVLVSSCFVLFCLIVSRGVCLNPSPRVLE